jgi:hypothetical protein
MKSSTILMLATIGLENKGYCGTRRLTSTTMVSRLGPPKEAVLRIDRRAERQIAPERKVYRDTSLGQTSTSGS